MGLLGPKATCRAAEACRQVGKPIWASEESSSYDDMNGAACWGRVINSHWVINKLPEVNVALLSAHVLLPRESEDDVFHHVEPGRRKLCTPYVGAMFSQVAPVRASGRCLLSRDKLVCQFYDDLCRALERPLRSEPCHLGDGVP